MFRKNPPYLKAAADQWCTVHYQSVCAALCLSPWIPHGLSVVTHLSLPQRPSSLISDSSVEPVPSPSGSSHSPSSSASTPFNDITSSVQSLNTTTTCTATVSHNYWNCLFFYLRRSGLFKNTNKDLFPFWISVFFSWSRIWRTIQSILIPALRHLKELLSAMLHSSSSNSHRHTHT